MSDYRRESRAFGPGCEHWGDRRRPVDPARLRQRRYPGLRGLRRVAAELRRGGEAVRPVAAGGDAGSSDGGR